MSYVVKVGEYYVSTVEIIYHRLSETETHAIIGDIILSKEKMREFTKANAERIAKKVTGVVVEIADNDVSNIKYKQLSLFDEEVDNG